jgi:hypothetical protein
MALRSPASRRGCPSRSTFFVKRKRHSNLNENYEIVKG